MTGTSSRLWPQTVMDCTRAWIGCQKNWPSEAGKKFVQRIISALISLTHFSYASPALTEYAKRGAASGNSCKLWMLLSFVAAAAAASARGYCLYKLKNPSVRLTNE